jgi:cytochrome c-type biogenesis protein CcmE
MKRKHKRLTFAFIGLGLLGVATALVLSAFEDSIVFFYSPTELKEKSIADGRQIRIGGLVEEDSIKRGDGAITLFRVTDLTTTIAVSFTGLLPDLFREGQGVVAEGKLKNGVFMASDVLAKHDENYMPPEVAEALKKSGQWNPEGDGGKNQKGQAQ